VLAAFLRDPEAIGTVLLSLTSRRSRRRPVAVIAYQRVAEVAL